MSLDHESTQASEKQAAVMQALRESYSAKLDEEMGWLYNQFVAFVSAAKVPLPNVILVLEMLKKDVVNQAFKKHLGE